MSEIEDCCFRGGNFSNRLCFELEMAALRHGIVEIKRFFYQTNMFLGTNQGRTPLGVAFISQPINTRTHTRNL